MTDIVVFTGTSLTWDEAKQLLDAEYRPPVKRNDINMLLDKRIPRIIGIIDGIFFDRAAVAHREIIRALKAGVTVVGGSSMGALRASELVTFGMIGVGQIYKWYHEGTIESDDEVAVTFHPETFAPLSIPLVNIRATLDSAKEKGIINDNEKKILLRYARSLYYPDRSYRSIIKKSIVSGDISPSRQDVLIEFFLNNEVDLKREDALQVIEKIKEIMNQ